MKLPKLKKPDRSQAADIFLHVLYGLMTFWNLGVFLHQIITKQPIEGMRFSIALWTAQTWFYSTVYRREFKLRLSAESLLRKSEGLSAAVHEINGLLLERFSKLHPDVLKEVGVSIRKKDV